MMTVTIISLPHVVLSLPATLRVISHKHNRESVIMEFFLASITGACKMKSTPDMGVRIEVKCCCQLFQKQDGLQFPCSCVNRLQHVTNMNVPPFVRHLVGQMDGFVELLNMGIVVGSQGEVRRRKKTKDTQESNNYLWK
jgi:hypothetical protein